MAFTFSQARALRPEESSPYNNLISNAMKNYQQGISAQYAPQRQQADIFSKEISPLAQLATSPNFKGFSPEVQDMIAARVSQYLGHGQSQPESNQPKLPTGQDIYDRLVRGANVTEAPGGRGKVAISNLAGFVKKTGLPFAGAVSQALGGDEAAGQNADLEQASEDAVRYLTMRGQSEQSARSKVARRQGESNIDYARRLKSDFVGKSNDAPLKSIDQKIAQDEQAKADAEATAQKFGTTADAVLAAQSANIKTAKEFKEFLKWWNNNHG